MESFAENHCLLWRRANAGYVLLVTGVGDARRSLLLGAEPGAHVGAFHLAQRAAGARRDGRAVGAGAGMDEEGADAVGGLGRKDVLEFASLFFDFRRIVHAQALGKEALGQPMAADDVGGA